MAFAQNHARPIEGAVATLGVSDRVDFLRKTYAHLGGALIAFAALTAFMMRYMTETSFAFSKWALQGRLNWVLIVVAFMVVGVIAQKLSQSNTSRAVQYLGLGLSVAAWSLLLQPILWIAMYKFGSGMNGAGGLILQAAGITLAIFVGLTITVFVTKKDFSFLRGALTVGMFAVLGTILASWLFGFHLGAIFCGAVILLMAGYILYQTTLVMNYFPPSGYVAASLMLFSTVAMLFWYVLQLLMSLRSD